MSTRNPKKREQDALLESITAFAKAQGCFGPQTSMAEASLEGARPLTPDQLLQLQTLFGHTDEMPIALTLGANPAHSMPLALAVGHQPTITLLEQNGAVVKSKKQPPKRSR